MEPCVSFSFFLFFLFRSRGSLLFQASLRLSNNRGSPPELEPETEPGRRQLNGQWTIGCKRRKEKRKHSELPVPLKPGKRMAESRRMYLPEAVPLPKIRDGSWTENLSNRSWELNASFVDDWQFVNGYGASTIPMGFMLRRSHVEGG
jgi:hypothetical protein